MAKVSLRSYNREIEQLIEQGHVDEAIAHCRHILKTFPKHLETYRMLGKAYLEAQRYEEAADIFGRLLMAVPDDFVAHVGLSIIDDNNGKLDDAIWHMERAFESQSSNSAIQAELQRLYGRRDGMEPPKVRMTRGALARVYAAGELYPQAIAEIRGVLAEDPQRADMQTLLAYCLFKNNQRADATDVCNQLLKRYLYSLDANRVLVELIPGSADAQSTQVYRMRIAEMDPYANFTAAIFQSQDVADAAISLERLDYVEAEETPMGQDWNRSALGYPSMPELGGGTSFVEEQPDWLRSDETPAPQTPPVEEPQPQATNEGIPDFLREAGWGQSSGPEQPTSIFDEEAEAEIVEADMPDWLKAQTPPADSIAPTQPPISHASEASNFLGSVDDDFDPFDGESAPSDIPEWLASASEGEVAPSFETSVAQPLSEVNEAELPDWLKSENNPTSTTVENIGDTPDWLKDLNETPALETESLDLAEEAGDLPDWLRAAEPKNEAPQVVKEAPAAQQPNVESLGASTQEQDDAVAWLESLAAKHGAKPEELVTDPNKRSETPPEWVAQAQSVGAQSPAKAEPESEPEKVDWSKNAANIGEEFFAEFEKGANAPPAMDETGMWLSTLESEQKSAAEKPLESGAIPEWLNEDEPSPAPARRPSLDTSSLTGWLDDLESSEEETPTETEKELVESQDLSDWLSGLDDEPGLDVDIETLRAPQPPFATQAPKQESKAEALPDWLSNADESQSEKEEEWTPPPPTLETSASTATVAADNDLPDWLQGMNEESVAETTPQPTLPSDWKSVVEAEKSAPVEMPRETRPLTVEPPAPEPFAAAKKKPTVKSKPKVAARPKKETPVGSSLLALAKAELDRGDIPEALAHYGKLIKRGKYLEEAIGHLSESLYRYPVEVGVWQALGDAYMRANRLKEALEAYNKAEELIR